MQETKSEEGNWSGLDEETRQEFFEVMNEARLVEKMNDRLAELEDKGETLVRRSFFHEEKARRLQKKLARARKRSGKENIKLK